MPKIESNKTYNKEHFHNIDEESIEIEKSEFTGCRFENCNLTKSSFNKCIFENCSFTKCNLSICHFKKSSLVDYKFDNSKLLGIDWSEFSTKIGLGLNCKFCDLSYSTFLNTDISNSKFIECKLFEVDFTHATIVKGDFTGSNFERAIIVNTNLKEADFSKAYNYYFNLKDNIVKKAKFTQPEVLNLLKPFGVVVE